MIELVEQLEVQGQNDKNEAIDNTTQRLKTLNEKAADLSDKTNILKEATDKQT